MKKTAYKFTDIDLGKLFMNKILELGYKEDEPISSLPNCTGIRNYGHNKDHNVVKFTNKLSSAEVSFQLETQWNEALEFAKEQINPTFKDGKWVKDGSKNDNLLFKWKDPSKGLRDGFDRNGNWGTNHIGSASEDKLIKATDKEIEQALIAEAERRDYEGKQIKIIRGSYKGELSGETMTGNYRYVNGKLIDYSPYAEFTLFDGENWAETIENTKIFDWGVEQHDKTTKIGCKTFDNDFLIKFNDTLEQLDGDTTAREIIAELEKLDYIDNELPF